MDAATQTATAAAKPQLEDQAATAALYVTNAHKQPKGSYPLDKDNKLSSAGAATSLKYANPRDLPSYPSAGLTNRESSAGAAASLANANHKTFEHWKPEQSAPASRAAMMAKDYKPAPLWQPEMSTTGSKAAMAAANHGGSVNVWRPESTPAGSSAAGQAMRNHKQSPAVDYGYTADGSSRALMAATGAMSGRKRAGSSPTVPALYPDSANSAANALNAATIAHKPKGPKSSLGTSDGRGSPTIDVARIHNAAITNLSREMYTSHPPVAPELEEKNRQAGIHAAAVSMAKQMYDMQQKTLEDAAGLQRSDSVYAASSVHRRNPSVSSSTDDSYRPPPQYANLQQAAQKLAAERLAKLHDEDAAYRDYYGAHAPIQSRLSVRGRLRRRASSDSGVPESDEVRSWQIRSEMSLFNDKLAQVDAKKRQKDRDSLLAAAQRNVAARMSGMDQKVFDETGKASPAMMSEWEAQAKARAEAESSARMANHGKVNIGGGQYMDQSEVEAIAAARIQPTLDDITEKADAQRERDEKARQDAEEQKQIAEEKAQIEKERSNRTKEEWKRFKDEEKREERAKKEEEKAKKAEEKRLRNEEKRKSKLQPEAETSGIQVDPESEQVKASKTPVLDPIPRLDPLSADADENTRPTTIGPDTGSAPTSEGEAVAQRIFSQPVVSADEPITSPLTSTEEAPSTPAVEESIAPTTVPTASTTDASSLPKHADPVSARIAPTTAASTGAAESQAPGDSSKPESKRLSSWLKGKFRRGNKSGNTQSEPSEMVISEPTNTTAPLPKSEGPATTPTSVDAGMLPTTPGASSALEVAMAGKDHPIPGSNLEPTHSHPTALTSHPPVLPAHSTRTHSTSISSLSSDEPTAAHYQDDTIPLELLERGRSRSLRRATTGVSTDDGYGDREQDYINSLKQQSDALGGGASVEGKGVGMDEGYSGRKRGSREGEEEKEEEEEEREAEGEEEEFEEARDTFDAEQLPLPSFAKEVMEGRKESPVRETRFHEEL